jgi:hypothetical protein
MIKKCSDFLCHDYLFHGTVLQTSLSSDCDVGLSFFKGHLYNKKSYQTSLPAGHN